MPNLEAAAFQIARLQGPHQNPLPQPLPPLPAHRIRHKGQGLYSTYASASGFCLRKASMKASISPSITPRTLPVE
jgi:hypothetical protein